MNWKIRSVKCLGIEAAMFTPTATMSNQIALKILTNPLDEIICDRTSHIYNYEVGGYAFHSGCSIRYLEGDRGIISAEAISKILILKTFTKQLQNWFLWKILLTEAEENISDSRN